jgi:hypothetical protein
MSQAPIDLIAAERERQKSVEGWTEAHDDEHADESLATVAAQYAMPEHQRHFGLHHGAVWPSPWPNSWALSWWKPTPDNRIRELVKAGALIVAEIERLQRRGPDAR